MGKTLGQKIKAIRLNLGKNMEEFGRMVDNANKGLVSRWENDKSIPGIERLHIIAKLGNISFEELMETEDIKSLIEVSSRLQRHLNITIYNVEDLTRLLNSMQSKEILIEDIIDDKEAIIATYEFHLNQIKEVSKLLSDELEIHNELLKDLKEINDILQNFVAHEIVNAINNNETKSIPIDKLLNERANIILDNKVLSKDEIIRALQILRLTFGN